MPEVVGADGLSLGSNPTGTPAHEGDAGLFDFPQARPAPSGITQGEGFSGLVSDTALMEEQSFPVSGCASGGCYEQEGCHDRCLTIRLGVPV